MPSLSNHDVRRMTAYATGRCAAVIGDRGWPVRVDQRALDDMLRTAWVIRVNCPGLRVGLGFYDRDRTPLVGINRRIGPLVLPWASRWLDRDEVLSSPLSPQAVEVLSEWSIGDPGAKETTVQSLQVIDAFIRVIEGEVELWRIQAG